MVIKVDISENFPITVALLDEGTGNLSSGETVVYDVRDANDLSLSPPISGTLTESTVASGIYKTTLSIPTPGEYICYASATGFVTSTEEIIVEAQNLYDLVKQERHYNLSVEDVVRTNVTPTASQTARKVPLNKTDYVVTRIKADDASDWSVPVTSGTVYAHYENIVTSLVPYKIGGEY